MRFFGQVFFPRFYHGASQCCNIKKSVENCKGHKTNFRRVTGETPHPAGGVGRFKLQPLPFGNVHGTPHLHLFFINLGT